MKFDRNILLFYFSTFSTALYFTLPIWLIYYTVNLGFSTVQAMILGSTAYFVSTLLDVPAGLLADKLNPKTSFYSGSVLVFMGTMLYLLPPNFWIYFISTIIQGMGTALISGCLDSLIFEYLLENKKDKDYSKIASNKQSIFFVGRISATLASVYLFWLNPVLPFILFGLANLLGAVFVYFMDIKLSATLEKKSIATFRKAINKTKHVLSRSAQASPLVATICLNIFIADIYFYSYPIILKQLLSNFNLIGYLFVFVSIFSAIGGQMYKHFISGKFGLSANIFLLGILAMSSLIFFNSVWSFTLALMFQGLVSGMLLPAFNSYWQPKIEKGYRTTLLSLFSFVIGVLSFFSSLVAGFAIDNFGIQVLLGSMLIISIVIVVITLIWINWTKLQILTPSQRAS